MTAQTRAMPSSSVTGVGPEGGGGGGVDALGGRDRADVRAFPPLAGAVAQIGGGGDGAVGGFVGDAVAGIVQQRGLVIEGLAEGLGSGRE